MAFCPKCGKEVAADAKFCTSCGAQLGEAAKAEEVKTEEGKTEETKAEEIKTEETPETGETLETPAGAQQENLGDTINEKAQQLMNTPDTTSEYDPADIEANKVLSLLSYLGILWLIPLLAAPNSRFAKFHTNQGLILWIANLIVGVAGGVLAIIPILGWLVALALGIIMLVLMIIGIVNAVQGRAKQLPIIGKYTLLK
ncbi:MAG: zinc ribbon domain-containing protein [Clostridia bacterium]|nr:zinc ribbon domain-containing protein [Clostridia bacterium]